MSFLVILWSHCSLRYFVPRAASASWSGVAIQGIFHPLENEIRNPRNCVSPSGYYRIFQEMKRKEKKRRKKKKRNKEDPPLNLSFLLFLYVSRRFGNDARARTRLLDREKNKTSAHNCSPLTRSIRYFRCLRERNQEEAESVLGEQESLLPTVQPWLHPKEKHDAASASRVRHGAEISVSLLRQALQVHTEHIRPHQEVSSWPSVVLQTALLKIYIYTCVCVYICIYIIRNNFVIFPSPPPEYPPSPRVRVSMCHNNRIKFKFFNPNASRVSSSHYYSPIVYTPQIGVMFTGREWVSGDGDERVFIQLIIIGQFGFRCFVDRRSSRFFIVAEFVLVSFLYFFLIVQRIRML